MFKTILVPTDGSKLADKAAQAAAEFAQDTHGKIISADPAKEITATASRHGCDAVFMESHGRRGIQRLLLGSVTQKVLAHSTLPVVVFHEGRRVGGQRWKASNAS